MSEHVAIVEANWGRDGDWWIELDGRRLGLLTDATWVDMFWWRYRLDLSASDDEARALLADRELWGSCRFTFRSVRFDRLVTTAFCAGKSGEAGPHDGFISMRGLAIAPPPPTLRDRLQLWWLRRFPRRPQES
ncbi:MAG: hypothetical protein SFX73_37455 [Kofleriaceae bacterium]|nr:hypothetical protein [Kofleriaceae bacterium]